MADIVYTVTAGLPRPKEGETPASTVNTYYVTAGLPKEEGGAPPAFAGSNMIIGGGIVA